MSCTTAFNCYLDAIRTTKMHETRLPGDRQITGSITKKTHVLIGWRCQTARIVSFSLPIYTQPGFRRRARVSKTKYSNATQYSAILHRTTAVGDRVSPPRINCDLLIYCSRLKGNEWKCSDLKRIRKPTRSRLSLTHLSVSGRRWGVVVELPLS